MTIADYRRRMDKLLAEYAHAKRTVEDEADALRNVEARQVYVEEAYEIIQQTAEAIQHRVHERINVVVSRCLSAVFDDPYEFRILFERKRGVTNARPVFVRNGYEVDPLKGAGLGVADVASFALRLSRMLLARPPMRRLAVLDEPFKFLSENFVNYMERAREMLHVLADEMAIQFVLVTHSKELETGTIVEIE